MRAEAAHQLSSVAGCAQMGLAVTATRFCVLHAWKSTAHQQMEAGASYERGVQR